MQNTWLSKQADIVQEFANRNDMKNFYDALKEVYGPSSSGASPLLNADGSTLITDKEEILKRWTEHFNNVLNRQSEINNDAIDRLPQIPVDTSMNDPPTLHETEKAIHILSGGKAPGSDSIRLYQQKSIGMGAPYLQKSYTNCSVRCGLMKQFPRNSKMLRLSTCTSARVTVKPVTIIEEYLCYP